MLSAGCAVGLGNVWRFPFIVGRNGGAAFLLVYLVFLALLGFPLLTAELAVGRASGSGVSKAMRLLAPGGSKRFWAVLGVVIFGGNLLLMSYYTSVGGWLLRYAAGYAARGTAFAGEDAASAFAGMISSPGTCVSYMLLCVSASAAVCACGVRSGVERAVKWMMMALLVLLGVLAAKSLALPGAAAGVAFYLKVDWAPLLDHPFRTCFEAMGQAFFTLSVGVGCMTIFGSYVGKERSLVTEAVWIIAIDTAVAFLSGLVVFPACAAFGVDVASGPSLIFSALPKVFAGMTGGGAWGAVFFFFLSLAALTTVIAVFECLIGGIMDETGWRRVPTSLLVGGAVAALSLPAVFGFNIWRDAASAFLSGMSVLDFEDFVFSQFCLPLGALATCFFCVWETGFGWRRFSSEASEGKGWRLGGFFRPYMRYVLPLILLAIFAGGLIRS